MCTTPLCKAWKGKYPVIMDPVSDDLFWRDRVRYETREEMRYQENWSEWRTGNFYEQDIKAASKRAALQKTPTKPKTGSDTFSSLTVDDIERMNMSHSEEMCLTKKVRDQLQYTRSLRSTKLSQAQNSQKQEKAPWEA
jgi:hypothetical protein